MHVRALPLCFLALTVSALAYGAGREIPVICKYGDLHSLPLVEVSAGTPGAHSSRSMQVGPSRSAWVMLPPGTSLAPGQRQPVPVRSLDAEEVELLLSDEQGPDRTAELTVYDDEGEGRAPVTLIQVRAETYSYALPQGCRMLAPDERLDYAEALLNNAGCLLPERAHRALETIPGAPREWRFDCGWEPDVRLAMHLMAKAAARGSLDAGWLLSQFYLGNVSEEFRDLHAAYLQLARTGGLGHASADLMTGIMRWRGNGIATPSAGAAFPVLLPHARSGVREAQGIIGTMYLTGAGVPENPIQAYAWCSLAAEGPPLLYTDAVACRDSAEDALSYDDMLAAHDLAVTIRNGDY